MRCYFYILIVLFLNKSLVAQDISLNERFMLSSNGGIGASYADKAFLLNLLGSFTLDYVIKNKWSIQLAPKYIWLVKWNEHYLTVPLLQGTSRKSHEPE
jgi:hypothetical protein